MYNSLKPGTYRLSELEELLGRTRKTIEKYIERFHLSTTNIEYFGRKVKAVVLNQSSINHLLREFGELQEEEVPKDSQESQEEIPKTPSTLPGGVEFELWEQLKGYQAEVRRLEVDNARLIAKAEAHEQLLALKDEALDAKNEAIQSLKAAMVVLERSKNQLEAEKLRLEDKQTPALLYEPTKSDLNKPKGFWEKLFKR